MEKIQQVTLDARFLLRYQMPRPVTKHLRPLLSRAVVVKYSNFFPDIAIAEEFILDAIEHYPLRKREESSGTVTVTTQQSWIGVGAKVVPSSVNISTLTWGGDEIHAACDIVTGGIFVPVSELAINDIDLLAARFQEPMDHALRQGRSVVHRVIGALTS